MMLLFCPSIMQHEQHCQQPRAVAQTSFRAFARPVTVISGVGLQLAGECICEPGESYAYLPVAVDLHLISEVQVARGLASSSLQS